jgi:hypothetical protein
MMLGFSQVHPDKSKISIEKNSSFCIKKFMIKNKVKKYSGMQ